MLRRRWLLCLTIAYASGVAAAGLFQEYIPALCAAILLAAVAAICFARRPLFAGALAAACMIGCVCAGARLYAAPQITSQPTRIEAKVTQVVREGLAVVSGVTVGDVRVPSRVLVFYDAANARPLPGQTLRAADADFFAAKPRTIPHGFDQRLYAAGFDAKYVAYADFAEFSGKGSLIGGNVQKLRDALEKSADRLFGQSAGLVKALTLGVRDGMAQEELDDFRNSGSMDILSISGLHVSLLCAALMFLVNRANLPYIASRAALGAALAFFAALTGAADSTVRAVLMSGMLLASQIIGREGDLLTALAAAALILLLVNPVDMFSAGFQLSFMSVLGIALFSKPIARRLTWMGKTLSASFSAVISAQIAIAPLIAYYYHQVYLVSFFTGPLVLPLVSVMLIVALPAMALAALLPVPAVAIWSAPAYASAQVLTYFVRAFASLPFAALDAPAPGAMIFALYYGGLLWLLASKRVPKTALAAVAASAVLLFAKPALLRSDRLTFTMYDIGSADCLVLRRGAQTVMVDCGNGSVWHSLRARGEDIDLLFITHPHEDHCGGLKELAQYVKIKKIVLCSAFDAQDYPPGALEGFQSAMEGGAQLAFAQAGDSVPAGGMTFEVLSPGADYGSVNENSMALCCESGGVRALLMADAGEAAEYFLSVPKVDLLKVAHQGSATASGERMLRAAQPRLALISVGPNVCGHPTQETLARLAQSGARIMTTWEYGTIRVRFDPEAYVVDFPAAQRDLF